MRRYVYTWLGLVAADGGPDDGVPCPGTGYTAFDGAGKDPCEQD
jgi:hypothetical protein